MVEQTRSRFAPRVSTADILSAEIATLLSLRRKFAGKLSVLDHFYNFAAWDMLAAGRFLGKLNKEDCMSALIRQVALVSLTQTVPARVVMQISAALQKQATRDLGSVWDVRATVDGFDQLGHVPV